MQNIRGDALEIIATFSVGTHTNLANAAANNAAVAASAATPAAAAAAAASAATSFGVTVRVGGGSKGCNIGYSTATQTITATGGNDGGAAAIGAGIVPQPTAGTVELHIFLDRCERAIFRNMLIF